MSIVLPARATGTAIALALAYAAPAEAASPEPGPYRLAWGLDLAVLAIAGAAWALPALVLQPRIEPSCPCASADVNHLDRIAVAPGSRLARRASDGLVAALVALPFGLDALDVGGARAPWAGFATDALVMGQAIMLNGAVNQAVKMVARRPRPLVYDVAADAPVVGEGDSYLSFYSAHTSTAFAAGMAYATTFSLRHPGSRGRASVYAAAAAAGSAVGLLRVLGGKHFPSDVLTGAVAGSAIGLLVPRLHVGRPAATALVLPTRAGATLLLQAVF